MSGDDSKHFEKFPKENLSYFNKEVEAGQNAGNTGLAGGPGVRARPSPSQPTQSRKWKKNGPGNGGKTVCPEDGNGKEMELLETE